MIREIGKTLDIAIEKEIEFVINGKTYRKFCTPMMLKEFAIGFLISEGVVESINDIRLEVNGDRIVAEVSGDTSELNLLFSGFFRKLKHRIVKSNRKFRLEDLRKNLELIEIEEYKKTRGYHVALVVTDDKFYRAFDVGRHNAVDKAIGYALLNGVEFENSYLLLSGRISKEIALKCVNARIPLVVSKAAIFSSAIEFCKEVGLSAVSFATNLAIGDAIE
ncbi:MAG: formate dehydrogenase accessory sulfurtransferase FdhD [Archaeoglobaceae archaeon]|nr:formate dehydrogenase accessory sulfurtransferase FdhD [Archaeoglobaceae archaeon]MDW8117470.1 formate dehydrogenase accessory sulfurtransferase FdhD [Archaeoglobaceae archaeon]